MKPASEMHLETALPPPSRGLFTSMRERLAQRPDTEHQAAITRIGGDEFVLILSDIDSSALLSITRKIIDTIASTPEITGKSVTLSSSVGIATYPDSGRTLDELIVYADAAMYRSKRAGKNCFCLHGESQTMWISPTPKVNTRPD